MCSHEKQPFFCKKLGASITVEAAIAIPVFLISLVPFLYLSRMMLAQTILEDGLARCLREFSCDAYILSQYGVLDEDGLKDIVEANSGEEDDLSTVTPKTYEGAEEIFEMSRKFLSSFGWGDLVNAAKDAVADLAGQLLLKEMLQEELAEEDLEAWGVEGGWNGVSLDGSRFFCQEGDHGYLISARVTISWQSPFSFWDTPETAFSRVTHIFVGEKNNEASSGSGEAGSEETEQETVYQMGGGTHFHQKTCYLIHKNILCLDKDTALSLGLEACSRCGGGSGPKVYMTDGGESFHDASCSYLFPALRSLTKEQALSEGLLPCGICFGREGYFS